MMHRVPLPDTQTELGWYGKIPGAGDFVERRLGHALCAAWERWMSNGLSALQQQAPRIVETHYTVAPVWNFLLPAGLGLDCVQLGALAPSCDRVGRYYPVAAALVLPRAEFESALLDGAGPFYRRTGEALLAAIRHGHSPERLDATLATIPTRWPLPRAGASDILAVLAPAGAAEHCTAWPDLSLYFDSDGVTGFWWTHQGDGSPLQTHVHTGELNNALFARLFGPQHGAAR